MSQSEKYFEDWIKVAHKDLQRAKRNLRELDAEAAGFSLSTPIKQCNVSHRLIMVNKLASAAPPNLMEHLSLTKRS